MEKYLKLIQSTDKSLKINNYEVNDIGADNLVIIVNNDLVFKFSIIIKIIKAFLMISCIPKGEIICFFGNFFI